MESAFRRIADKMRERELRFTPQRQAVVETLLEHWGNHLSAEEVFQQAQVKCPDLGLATVYRTLDLLTDMGFLYKTQFNEDCSRYEFNLQEGGHFHHHLICLNCGTIFEFDEDLLENLESEIAAKNGFKIVDHSLRFFGYCLECQEKAGRGE